MDPYDNSVFEKKFYGFRRHSNNPNYARLPKTKLTPYRKITDVELDRMDNTLFNNKEEIIESAESLFDLPPVTEAAPVTTVPTTLQPSPKTTTAACVGTEKDIYDKCPVWAHKCNIQDVHLTCAYTCNKCNF